MWNAKRRERTEVTFELYLLLFKALTRNPSTSCHVCGLPSPMWQTLVLPHWVDLVSRDPTCPSFSPARVVWLSLDYLIHLLFQSAYCVVERESNFWLSHWTLDLGLDRICSFPLLFCCCVCFSLGHWVCFFFFNHLFVLFNYNFNFNYWSSSNNNNIN